MEQYTLTIDNSHLAFTEVEAMLAVLYPHFFDGPRGTEKAHWWEKFKRDRDALVNPTLILAQSPKVERLHLGFIVGGWHPHYRVAHILAMGVYPNARRSGVGTALVKRWFTATCLVQASAICYHDCAEEPYEVANFIQAVGGKLVSQSICEWLFEIPNPYL